MAHGSLKMPSHTCNVTQALFLFFQKELTQKILIKQEMVYHYHVIPMSHPTMIILNPAKQIKDDSQLALPKETIYNICVMLTDKGF